MSWAAMKSASLTSAACAGYFEMTQPSGRFHRCTCLCPRLVLAGSARSKSVRCRFHTCRPVSGGWPGWRRRCAVSTLRPYGAGCGRVGCGRTRHLGVVEGAGDPRRAVPGQPLGEHPLHDVCCFRVWLKPVRAPPPRGVRLVRVRSRVTGPVPVRRPPAQVPALLSGLGGHCGADPDPGPGDLPLGRPPEREHGLLAVLRVRDRGHAKRSRAAIARREAPGEHGPAAGRSPAAHCHAEAAHRHSPRAQLPARSHT